jgi:hypothetical protein
MKIPSKFRLMVLTMLLVGVTGMIAAQDAASLKAMIQKHYSAIHAGELEDVWSHHLPEFTMFLADGHILWESGFGETADNMGMVPDFGKLNVTMKHFSAQIYDNVGIATFYLDGIINGEPRTTRVSAVWIWNNGEWKEAHHHESLLSAE